MRKIAVLVIVGLAFIGLMSLGQMAVEMGEKLQVVECCK